MTNHIVTTYTRSIFDDDIEDGSIEDFSDEPCSVTAVPFDRAEMLAIVVREGLDLADGQYKTFGEDENLVGYRVTLDDKDANSIRFNVVHLIEQDSRHLKAYDIEAKVVTESKKLYVSMIPSMQFFTTVLDMYSGEEAQKIDASIQQAIEDLSLGWLFNRLDKNNVN